MSIGVQLIPVAKDYWLLHGMVDAWIKLDSDDEHPWQVLNADRQSVGHHSMFYSALSHAYALAALNNQ